MKASIFMAAALAGAGTPALAGSVIGMVPAHGGRRVAISPQLPDGSLSTAEKDALTFDVLSDIGNAVARLYGLVYALPEELRAVLRSNNAATLEQALATLGGLDILVNNAGGVRAGRLENVPEAEPRAMVDVNLVAPILLTRAALPALRQSGDAMVVNIASDERVEIAFVADNPGDWMFHCHILDHQGA